MKTLQSLLIILPLLFASSCSKDDIDEAKEEAGAIVHDLGVRAEEAGAAADKKAERLSEVAGDAIAEAPLSPTLDIEGAAERLTSTSSARCSSPRGRSGAAAPPL